MDEWFSRDAFMKSEQREFLHQRAEKFYGGNVELQKAAHEFTVPRAICGKPTSEPLPFYMNDNGEQELDDVILKNKSEAEDLQKTAENLFVLQVGNKSEISPVRLISNKRRERVLKELSLWSIYEVLFEDIEYPHCPTPWPVNAGCNAFHLDSLTTNLMNEILEHCNVLDVIALSQVNRRWRHFILEANTLLWKKKWLELNDKLMVSLDGFYIRKKEMYWGVCRISDEEAERIMKQIEELKNKLPMTVGNDDYCRAVRELLNVTRTDYMKHRSTLHRPTLAAM